MQSLVTFPLTPKYMTLNGHFTFNFQFSLLPTAFQRLGYIFYRRAIYRIFLLYDVTSRDMRKRTVKTVISRILRLRERIADLSYTKSCLGNDQRWYLFVTVSEETAE